jgi:hypothetical protein
VRCDASKNSPLFELANVLVRFDHVASFIRKRESQHHSFRFVSSKQDHALDIAGRAGISILLPNHSAFVTHEAARTFGVPQPPFLTPEGCPKIHSEVDGRLGGRGKGLSEPNSDRKSISDWNLHSQKRLN